MTTLRKGMLQITFCRENFDTFADSILSTTQCEADITLSFAYHKELEAQKLGFFDSYKELFLRTWAAMAYELKGDYHNAAMCHDRAANVAWGLKLYNYRVKFLQHCVNDHLLTDRPEKLENASYGLLKIASSLEGPRLEKLRTLSRAELGFICAGMDFEKVKLTAKILKDIRCETLGDLLDCLLHKKKSLESDEDRETLTREVLFSSECLKPIFYTKLDKLVSSKRLDHMTKTIVHVFLGRHYEANEQNLDAGNSYQYAVINNTNFLAAMNQEFLLRTAINYVRAGTPNPAVLVMQKAQPKVNETAPEFSEAFADRITQLREQVPKPL